MELFRLCPVIYLTMLAFQLSTVGQCLPYYAVNGAEAPSRTTVWRAVLFTVTLNNLRYKTQRLSLQLQLFSVYEKTHHGLLKTIKPQNIK